MFFIWKSNLEYILPVIFKFNSHIFPKYGCIHLIPVHKRTTPNLK